MNIHVAKNRGVTLIELIIVIAVLALLVRMALPSYEQYVLRSNRAEAIEILLATAACQERVYTKFHQYDTNRCLDVTTTPNGHYVVSMSTSNSNQNYTLTATAQANQAKDSCGNLTLTDLAVRGSSKSSDKAAIARCWSGRSL